MSLQAELENIIAESGAHMGVAVHHIETGEWVTIAADEPFPLCSVLKIPVLVEAFRQMEQGAFTLDDRWELTTAEKNMPSGTLVHFEDGLLPTVRDLLTLMIIISDNTATDMLMHRLGTERINQTMHEFGLTDTHITMTIREIFEDLFASADPTQDQYEFARKRNRPGGLKRGLALSNQPENDVGSPRDMTRLLTMIYQGEIIGRDACDGMLKILLKQQLNDRLARFLPPGTPVAHKTGTLPGIRNDAGIIYVADNAHVAVTVFSRWDDQAADTAQLSRQRMYEIDTTFGLIGRAIYDHYLKT